MGAGGSGATSSSGAGAPGPVNSGAASNTNPSTGNTDARTGIANGIAAPQSDANQGSVNGQRTGVVATPGTNSAGTAGSSGPPPAATTQGAAPAGGIGRPTTTDQRDTDAKIDQENTNVDRTVKKICKNC